MAPYAPIGSLCIEVPIDETTQWSTMFKVIGKEGKVFKAITHQSGASYIWWNQAKNLIEVWAYDVDAAVDAVNRVVHRLQYFQYEQDKNTVIFGTFNDSIFYKKQWP